MKAAWVLVAVSLIAGGCRRSSSSRAKLDASGGPATPLDAGVGSGGAGAGGTGGSGTIANADAAADAAPDASVVVDVALDTAPADVSGADAVIDTASPDLSPDLPAGPDGPPPMTPQFHLTLPLSSAVVSTHSPTVGWTDPGGTDYFIIELCRDVSCAEVLERNYSGLTTYTVMSTLPDGVVYWRVKGMLPSNRGQLTTATNELFVGPQTAHDTSMLAYPDFNRDGVPDVALAAEGGDVTVRSFKSDPAGPMVLGTPQTLPGPARALAYGIDLNADGFGDLLLARADAIDVYYGSSTSLYRVGSIAGGTSLAGTLAGVGDVNGDGFGDVVVGTQAPAGPGTAALYLSSRTGLSKPTGAALASARFGAAGDVNADGYADVVTCSVTPAKLSLYTGAAAGLVPLATHDDPRGAGSAGSFGNACQGVGDINGDGFGDVVVTGSSATNLLAFVYFGGEKGFGAPTTVTVASATGHTADELLLAPAGDIDHDGRSDVLITGAGAVRLFLASQNGLGEQPAATVMGDYRLAAGLGDLNGDRKGDVLIAPRACGEAVKILGGTATGLTATPIYTFPAMAACPGPLLAR